MKTGATFEKLKIVQNGVEVAGLCDCSGEVDGINLYK